jgi:hypothetical protein
VFLRILIRQAADSSDLKLLNDLLSLRHQPRRIELRREGPPAREAARLLPVRILMMTACPERLLSCLRSLGSRHRSASSRNLHHTRWSQPPSFSPCSG